MTALADYATACTHKSNVRFALESGQNSTRLAMSALCQKRPNAPQPICTVGTRHRISGLLPRPRPAEGRLKRIVHHRVAPPFHMRRALPLRTFRFSVCPLWLDLRLQHRDLKRLCGRIYGRLDRCGYDLGPGRRWRQTDKIDYCAGRRLVGGQTGIGDASRLHQLVQAEREAHGHRATDDGIDGERHSRAVDVSP